MTDKKRFIGVLFGILILVLILILTTGTAFADKAVHYDSDNNTYTILLDPNMHNDSGIIKGSAGVEYTDIEEIAGTFKNKEPSDTIKYAFLPDNPTGGAVFEIEIDDAKKTNVFIEVKGSNNALTSFSRFLNVNIKEDIETLTLNKTDLTFRAAK